MTLPLIGLVHRPIPHAALPDAAKAIVAALEPRLAGIAVGDRIAITIGSRGIHDALTILRAAGRAVRAAGGVPVGVPAMGSHAGGSSEGRAVHLERMGITAERIGYDLLDGSPRAVATSTGGVGLYCSEAALGCQGILACNRVKPHSSLMAPLGSGLRKMLTVGLGGPEGAASLHAAGLADHLVDAATVLCERLPIVAGLAIVEDGWGDVAAIEAMSVDELGAADERLLALSDSMLPRLPIAALDALFVRRMGKDCSGVGMDSNVIGLSRRLGGAGGSDDHITIGRIAVGDLTPATGGNALGVGMADVVTAALVERMNPEVTGLNARTAGFLGGDRIPEIVPTDRDAVAALCRGHSPDGVRLALIRDTAHLERFWVSGALLDGNAGGCDLDSQASPIPFDDAGGLTLDF